MKNIIIISILKSYLPFISSSLFTFSIVLLYLDNWRLSNNKIIKLLQVFSFISVPFLIIVLAYNETILIDIINCVNDKDNNINLHGHGHVTLDKDAGKAIGQGLSTIGSQIGLGATMVGVGTAVGKAIGKSGMPPLQKAGLIVGASIFGGIGHSTISSINRRSVLEDYINKGNISSSDITKNISSDTTNKLVNDTIPSSPLEDLLSNLEMIDYVSLGIIYILIIQLIFKLYFKDKINLNLSKLLGDNTNNKIEFYLNKIIKLNKQMSIVWILFGFITLIFGLSISAYAIHDICVNIDSYINIHNELKSNSINNISITNKSIKDILLNLKIVNYISLITVITLMLQITLKFYYNKNINNIYIWLALSVLILTLAFAAYTYGDLYTHLDNYVNMYINLKNK